MGRRARVVEREEVGCKRRWKSLLEAGFFLEVL